MILVFGGTTEGKIVASILEKEHLRYFYSTKTEIEFDTREFGRYRFGAFTNKDLIEFCTKNNVKVIIHASHPFAEELHKTIFEASSNLNIPVIRFERTYTEKSTNELIQYVTSYENAIDFLISNKIQSLLALTGVQTIVKLKPFWKNYKTIFRILPRDSSLSVALEQEFPKENLILEFPSDDLNYELDVVLKSNCEAVITKESGNSGFLDTKIKVALMTKTPLIIIQKPVLPSTFISVKNKEALVENIFNYIKRKIVRL